MSNRTSCPLAGADTTLLQRMNVPRTPADERCGTVPRMVRMSAAEFGASEAVVDGEQRLSYRDVENEMLDIARSLVARGVSRGDRVAIWAPNSITWITTALGVLATGAWLVPLNTRFKGQEAAYILDKARVRTLFVANGFLGNDYLGWLANVKPELCALEDTVLLPLPGERSTASWEAFRDQRDGASATMVDALIDAGSPDDVCDVIFTSGTTGTPKGVMLRHGASLRGYELFGARFELGRGDRYVIPTPFFHCFGYKAGWMVSLMSGAIAYPLAVFDPGSLLQLIERERITHLPGPPTLFTALCDHPQRTSRDLASLRCAMIGAASIPPIVIERMRAELGFEHVLVGYGLTETHALVCLTDASDPPQLVATTVGRPLPETELRIVDDGDHDVAAGTNGEIVVRTPYRMSGYLDDEEATAKTIVDGWVHTGDVGFVDDDGYVHITDRKKDMFIVGGFNVAPAEVERAILGFEGVAQVAVVGMPDDHLGEVGAAFVVLHDGADVTAEDVIAHSRQRLANYKVPRNVQILDALPLNATGKVLKTVLREMLAAEVPSTRGAT